MIKKKILVCGSAGFLMSNLIRYMLYRDEDRNYEFASIDILSNPKRDYKRVYIHRKHQFYVGDVCDTEILKRIIHIEQPSFIVNGVGIRNNKVLDNARNIINAAYSIHEASNGVVPVIQIIPEPGMNGLGESFLYWRLIGSLARDHGGIELQIPKCFGLRDRHGMLVTILRNVLSVGDCIPKSFTFSDIQEGWVYAEDVASRIWYAIEYGVKGSVMTMPILGKASPEQINKIVDESLKLGIYREEDWCNNEDLGYKETSSDSWEPDSNSIKQSLMKTVQWFNMNRWALEV